MFRVLARLVLASRRRTETGFFIRSGTDVISGAVVFLWMRAVAFVSGWFCVK
jgi:hypothetical protein